jgi:hypothetical protein
MMSKMFEVRVILIIITMKIFYHLYTLLNSLICLIEFTISSTPDSTPKIYYNFLIIILNSIENLYLHLLLHNFHNRLFFPKWKLQLEQLYFTIQLNKLINMFDCRDSPTLLYVYRT